MSLSVQNVPTLNTTKNRLIHAFRGCTLNSKNISNRFENSRKQNCVIYQSELSQSQQLNIINVEKVHLLLMISRNTKEIDKALFASSNLKILVIIRWDFSGIYRIKTPFNPRVSIRWD